MIIAGIVLIAALVVYYLFVRHEQVTFESLLKEMVDRNKLTEFSAINYQTKQTSSYNRASVSPDAPGWFEDADGLGCIRVEGDKVNQVPQRKFIQIEGLGSVRVEEDNEKREWVLMEDKGPGAIVKMWAVCFYYGLKDTIGANLNIYLDGSKKPIISTNLFKLLKGQDFIKAPFADQSVRAGNLYLPIPYAKSCKITMDKKVFYNIINYRKYEEGTSVKTFTMEDFNQNKPLIKKIGKQLLAKAKEPAVSEKHKKLVKERTLQKHQNIVLNLPEGGHAISYLEIKMGSVKDTVQALRSLVIQGIFDDTTTVWAPVGDFFSNVKKIQPYHMWERSIKEDGTMICRWLMPYAKKANVVLKNLSKAPIPIKVTIVTQERKWTEQSMYFYAVWRMSAPTTTYPIYDYNFLEATGKGILVGDAWTVLNPVEGWWGEGDEKIYIDEDFQKNFPSHFGTGTEDYYGWAGGVVPTSKDEFSKPFLGNVIVANPNSKGYNVCTRTRSLDAIPFRERIKFDIESSCGKRSSTHFLQYSDMVFWYALPDTKYNRMPTKQKATETVPEVADLEQRIKQAQSGIFSVKDAIEAENLKFLNKSDGVKIENIDNKKWRKDNYIDGLSGEISGGKAKSIYFKEQSDFISFRISEQFKKAYLSIGASLNTNSGVFDIFVNNKKIVRQNYRGERNRMSVLDLGQFEPQENAFVIRIAYVGNIKGVKLNLDYFLVKDSSQK